MRKRPNEQFCECDWSNFHTSIFKYGNCDTKRNDKIYINSSLKLIIYISTLFIRGSLNNPILGGKKVNIMLQFTAE